MGGKVRKGEGREEHEMYGKGRRGKRMIGN